MPNPFIVEMANRCYDDWPKKSGSRKEAIRMLVKSMERNNIDFVVGRVREYIDIVSPWLKEGNDVQFVAGMKKFCKDYLNLSHGGWHEQRTIWKEKIYATGEKARGNLKGTTRQPSGSTNFKHTPEQRVHKSYERKDQDF